MEKTSHETFREKEKWGDRGVSPRRTRLALKKEKGRKGGKSRGKNLQMYDSAVFTKVDVGVIEKKT